MQRKSAPHNRKSRHTEAKLLITTLSFAVTLGGWQALARQEVHTAAGPAGGPAAVQPPAQFALEVEPLPTLIPSSSEQPGSISPARSSPAPSGRLFLGGSKPQPPRPAPIARTGSSR